MIPELVARQAARALAQFCLRPRAGAVPDISQQWDADGVSLFVRDETGGTSPLARCGYSEELHQWFLFSPDPRRGWRPCLDLPPGLGLSRLLAYVEQDPLHQFWPG